MSFLTAISGSIVFSFWNAIAEHGSLRFMARVALTPLVYAIKYPVAAGLLFLLMIVAMLGRRMRAPSKTAIEPTQAGENSQKQSHQFFLILSPYIEGRTFVQTTKSVEYKTNIPRFSAAVASLPAWCKL